MNLLDALVLRAMPADSRRALVEIRRAQAAGSIAAGNSKAPIWGKANPNTYTDEGYQKLALIYRCVGITSSSMAKGILQTVETMPSGETKARPDHPLEALLRQPNPEMRQNRFLSVIGMMASVAGFVVIEKERNQRNEVIALWPLEPHRCSPILRNQAPADWEYKVPRRSRPIELSSRDVIVYTYADRPDLLPIGIGPTEVAFREVGLINIMTDFLKAFFDHGAQPQYGLILDKGIRANQQRADDIKQKWNRRFGGLLKSLDPAVLEGVTDVKRLSFDFNELAWQQLRDLADVAICQAFGVSPLLVDAIAGLGKATFSNHADARKGFYDETVSSLWTRLDDVLTLGLLPEFEPPGSRISLEFDTSRVEALQPDRDKKAVWVLDGFSRSLYSNHVALRELDMPVPAGLPEFYVRAVSVEAIPADDPLGLQAAEAAKEAEDDRLLAQLEALKNPALPAGGEDDDAGTPDTANETDDETVRRMVRGARETRAARAGTNPAEVRAAVGVANRELVTRIANRTQPWFSTFFREQGVRLLSAASRAGALDMQTRSIAEIDWDAEARALAPYMTRAYHLAGEIAYGSVGEILNLGMSFDLANPELANVRELLGLEVKEITDESRRVVADTVTAGLVAGDSLDAITKTLAGKFESWTKARARRVARTESMKSFGYANASAFRASNVVSEIQCFDNENHTENYGASDGLTCATRNGFIAPLENAEKHIDAEHPNGSLVITPVIGE